MTNLLYMLYHIDDSTESLTGGDGFTNGTTASAVSTTGGALGALPIAVALDAAKVTTPTSNQMQRPPSNHSFTGGIPKTYRIFQIWQ